MSGRERIEISVLGSQGFVQKYRTIRKNTAQTEPETSRADTSFMRKEGDNISCTLDSWVVPVSPVAEGCCVLAALANPFSSLIAREKTVLKYVRVISRRLSRLTILWGIPKQGWSYKPGVPLKS